MYNDKQQAEKKKARLSREISVSTQNNGIVQSNIMHIGSNQNVNMGHSSTTISNMSVIGDSNTAGMNSGGHHAVKDRLPQLHGAPSIITPTSPTSDGPHLPLLHINSTNTPTNNDNNSINSTRILSAKERMESARDTMQQREQQKERNLKGICLSPRGFTKIEDLPVKQPSPRDPDSDSREHNQFYFHPFES
jgi:hypothetical protein